MNKKKEVVFDEERRKFLIREVERINSLYTTTWLDRLAIRLDNIESFIKKVKGGLTWSKIKKSF